MNIVIILFIIIFLITIYLFAPNLALSVWIIIAALMSFIVYDYYYTINKISENNSKQCVKTGCSGQTCSSRPEISTGEWKCEYDCYKNSNCVNIDGQCQWEPNEKINKCFDKCKNQILGL